MPTYKKHHSDTLDVSRIEVTAQWVQLMSLATSCYNVGTIYLDDATGV